MIRKVPTLSGDAVTTHNYSIVFPIDDQKYTLFFSYNARMRRWIVTIDTAAGTRVVTGAVALLGVDLFSYSAPGLRPRGFMICVSTANAAGAPEPEEFDLGRAALLLHFDRTEDLDDTGPQVPPLS